MSASNRPTSRVERSESIVTDVTVDATDARTKAILYCATEFRACESLIYRDVDALARLVEEASA